MARPIALHPIPAIPPDISFHPFAALQAGSALATRYLLLLRFAVLNMVACALVGAAWFQGWIIAAYDGDQTRMVVVIAAVFAVGFITCGNRIRETSEDLNRVKAGVVPSWLALPEWALRLKLGARFAGPRYVANSLVFLGLIGTVIGFIIALSGVRPDAASDVAAIGPMISTLITGMGVALYTTLVGAVLNIWLMLNVRLLEGGCVALVVAVAEGRE